MNRPTAGARFERALPVGKHPLQLYSLGTPNGQKVTVLLEELGLDYDAWKCDIVADPPAQFSSGFVEANPNSKIPVLMDHMDAKSHGAPPTRVFESCHILLHLCEAAGASGEKFLQSARVDPRGRTECLNWLFWQAASAPYIGGGFWHFSKDCPNPQAAKCHRCGQSGHMMRDCINPPLARSAPPAASRDLAPRASESPRDGEKDDRRDEKGDEKDDGKDDEEGDARHDDDRDAEGGRGRDDRDRGRGAPRRVVVVRKRKSDDFDRGRGRDDDRGRGRDSRDREDSRDRGRDSRDREDSRGRGRDRGPRKRAKRSRGGGGCGGGGGSINSRLER